PVVAAAGIGMKPFHARNQFDNLQLLDFMIEASDLRLFQFNPAPFFGFGLVHPFDDFDDSVADGDSLLLQLEKTILRRRTSLIRILENTIFALSNTAAASMAGRVAISAAAAIFVSWSRAGDW